MVAVPAVLVLGTACIIMPYATLAFGILTVTAAIVVRTACHPVTCALPTHNSCASPLTCSLAALVLQNPYGHTAIHRLQYGQGFVAHD